MKARIKGTDLFVSYEGLCEGPNDNIMMRVTILNGRERGELTIVPFEALVEIEKTEAERELDEKNLMNRVITTFACTAMHAIITNPHRMCSSKYSTQDIANDALDIAKTLYASLSKDGYHPTL